MSGPDINGLSGWGDESFIKRMIGDKNVLFLATTVACADRINRITGESLRVVCDDLLNTSDTSLIGRDIVVYEASTLSSKHLKRIHCVLRPSSIILIGAAPYWERLIEPQEKTNGPCDSSRSWMDEPLVVYPFCFIVAYAMMCFFKGLDDFVFENEWLQRIAWLQCSGVVSFCCVTYWSIEFIVLTLIACSRRLTRFR